MTLIEASVDQLDEDVLLMATAAKVLAEEEATSKRHGEEVKEVRAELEVALRNALAKAILLESDNKMLKESVQQQKLVILQQSLELAQPSRSRSRGNSDGGGDGGGRDGGPFTSDAMRHDRLGGGSTSRDEVGVRQSVGSCYAPACTRIHAHPCTRTHPAHTHPHTHTPQVNELEDELDLVGEGLTSASEALKVAESTVKQLEAEVDETRSKLEYEQERSRELVRSQQTTLNATESIVEGRVLEALTIDAEDREKELAATFQAAETARRELANKLSTLTTMANQHQAAQGQMALLRDQMVETEVGVRVGSPAVSHVFTV